MSDLRIYELEDNVWEEFGDNNDLIAPHNGDRKDEHAVGSDSSKRPRYELSCIESNASRSSSRNFIQRKEETGSIAVKEEEEIMLEKSQWSHLSSTTSVSQEGESNRRTSHSTSDEDKFSNPRTKSSNMDSFSNELCAADPILGDRAALVDNNVFRYQLNNASNNDNSIDFFSNNLEDKEGTDLLYYGWPEIENFEDVDRMFRSCDSTFGLEIDKDDELGWFSSAHEIEGSDDGLKLSFNLSACDPQAVNCASGHQEIYGLNNSGMLVNENEKKLTPASSKKGSQKMTPNGSPNLMNYSYADGSGAVPCIDNGSQIQSHGTQLKEQKPSEEKRKERPPDNGDYFIHMDDLKPVEESKHSLNFQCNFVAETHMKQETGRQSCSQTPIPLLGSNDNQPSNSASPRSSVKSEDSGLPYASPRESSYGSSQMQAVEGSYDVSCKNPAVLGNKKKERSHQRRLSGQLEKSKSMVQRADSDSVSGQKKVQDLENEVEGQSEVNGTDTGIPGELDSSNVQESSCVSSVLDEVSIEASGFRQLQRVMEQLDIRTKLCIRDSLYRLARSAEQRHKCVSQTIAGGDGKDGSGAVISDETNKSAGYMDVETDTNPIDRSIAHLLFHRPSDPSTTAVLDAVSAKSNSMVQASNNVPVMAEKLISQEDTISAHNEATKQ